MEAWFFYIPGVRYFNVKNKIKSENIIDSELNIIHDTFCIIFLGIGLMGL